LQFTKAEPFDPQAAERMRAAFHAAWQSLVDAGSPLAREPQGEDTRDTLASVIIKAAQAGEHNVEKLRDHALAMFAQRPVRDGA
jgi:hypothetical protein